MSKWISVNEKLPKHEGQVLVYNPLGESCGVSIFIAEFYDDGSSIDFHAISGGYDEQGITHWQELPDAPDETNTEINP